MQLCHGMMEYGERYGEFAHVLAEGGYLVQAHDQRGHGGTAPRPDDLGFISDTGGFDRVVLDVGELIEGLRAEFPGKPVVLLGHSFGSFVAQAYMERFGGSIDGCILSGTAGPRPLLIKGALALTRVIIAFKGPRYRSPLIRRAAFGTYNDRIADKRTFSDWITRDPAEVAKYRADPWCTFLPTLGFFRDMFTGLAAIHRPAAIAAIPAALPVLLYSGTDDPVGSYGKTVTALARAYRTAGLTDVTVRLYDGGRHEMHHELNRAEVFHDVLEWLGKR
jgi:alpha-beta hydrolase superfamily lysophospholipase